MIPEKEKIVEKKRKVKCDTAKLRGMVESGMSNDDIAKELGTCRSNVTRQIKVNGLTGIRKKGAKIKEKKDEPVKKEEKEKVIPGYNADHHLCKTCRWRTAGYKQRIHGCDYSSYHDHSRSYYCSVDNCFVYENGNPKKNKKTISI